MSFHTDISQSKTQISKTIDSRFDHFIDLYLESFSDMRAENCAHKKITLIARSPESPVAQALARRADELRSHNSNWHVIFAKLGPQAHMLEWLDHSSPLSVGDIKSYLRWAKNPGLLDAHEQLTLGEHMCWAGDAMRRTPGVRDFLEIFDEECAHSVRLGHLAFNALWDASTFIPERRLKKMSLPLTKTPLCSNSKAANDHSLHWALNSDSWITTRH